ncbi:phosphatidylserine decarboxylase-domain-containing protein [Biscogniauxia sp. FL1348]|nr:phosphatidylserine decarboxylase-domain-containing protein [Biscogniauxia sp. FL1348]
MSWDSFFVREFSNIDTIRPIACKEDLNWIASSYEPKPFSLQNGVKNFDRFWLKGQLHSVVEMHNYYPQTSTFVGGTVYQAFLSAMSYHDGTLPFRRVRSLPPPNETQRYVAHVATRSMFLIDIGGSIGLVACLYIGMTDVSTCEILEKFQQKNLPQSVEKGEEIGMFHHGGSTHCLLFRKGLELEWVKTTNPETAERNIPIRSELAYACG